MRMPDRAAVDKLREQFPAGCRVVLDEMQDPYRKIPVGTQGTVSCCDDAATIHCAWDNGSSLGVAFGEDRCHKVSTEDEAQISLDWFGKHQQGENQQCPCCGAVMPGSVSRHALSRRADIMICDQDGMREAMEDAGFLPRLPLMEWQIMRNAQNGGSDSEKDSTAGSSAT